MKPIEKGTTQMETSKMTVQGKGFASAPPDAIAISLQLEGIKDT